MLGPLNLTEELDVHLWSMTKRAIEGNSVDNVGSFITLFRSIIRKGIHYRKSQYFQQFIYFPSQIFLEITALSRRSASYSGLANIILPILPLHLKEIIWFELGFYSEGVVTTEDRELLNQFYYHAFASFNNFFYLISRNQDWALLKIALNYFQQLPNDVFDDLFQKKLDLEDLKRMQAKSTKSENIRQIKTLVQEIEIAERFAEYKRRTLLAIRYWLFFLYGEDLIKAEQLMDVFAELNEFRFSPDDEVADLLFFRTQDLHKYMGWENWDFTNRPDGKVYFPPMASDWITKGFLLDRIMNNNSRFETITVPSELLRNVRDLKFSFEEDANRILNDFSKWGKILALPDEKDFRVRLEALLNSVTRVERKVIGEKEREIASIALSQQKISHFQNSVAAEWRKFSQIRKLFVYFQNRENVQESPIQLKRLGPFIFLEKGKVAFIDGEHNQPIYGIERMGADVGRNENSLFLTVIFASNIKKIEGPNVIDLILDAITDLEKDGVIPTIIMVGGEYLYRQNNIRNVKGFDPIVPQELTSFGLGSNFIGTIDGIPVLALQHDLLVGNFIVANFASAFLMRYRTNAKWIDNELAVNVNLVTQEIGEEKFRQDPMKWKRTDNGNELTDEEAKILIATSIVIDVETIADFFVVDYNSCRIGHIVETLE